MDDAFIQRIREINARINIRPASAGDSRPFTDLMNKQYRRKKKEDYFYWQFMRPQVPTRLFVALENDLFIGSYGIQVHTLSDSVLCGFTIDLLVREEYRYRALLVLFEKEAERYAVEKGYDAFEWFPDKRKSGEGWSENDIGKVTRGLIKKIAINHDIALSVHAPLQESPLEQESLSNPLGEQRPYPPLDQLAAKRISVSWQALNGYEHYKPYLHKPGNEEYHVWWQRSSEYHP